MGLVQNGTARWQRRGVRGRLRRTTQGPQCFIPVLCQAPQEALRTQR